MKNKNKPFGIIYSARNKITGEYYIGASRGDVETRRKDHIVKSNKGNGYQFHEAIATYGLDAFDWQ